MTRGLFITGTGTGVGKTWVTRGIARAFRDAGRSVAAIKPLETGCDPTPADAALLARACGRPTLANAPGLYRVASPVCPYAATIAGEAPPDITALTTATVAAAADADVVLVEGAGGMLVPLDRTRTMADFCAALGLPLLLVAADHLGVLSHALTTFETARVRDLPVAAVVLVRSDDDASTASNMRILDERLPVPVRSFRRCKDDDYDLRCAAIEARLLDLL
jgi:dethiobiotin synthetase